MMMLLACDFIPEMTIARLSGTRQAVLGQKLERAVDRGLCETGQLPFGQPVHLTRRKVSTGMTKHVQDCQTLGRETIAAGAELKSVFSSTRHRKTYCKFLQ